MSNETGMAPAMDDFDGPGFVALTPVETLPPVVTADVPLLDEDERQACFMAAKRLMDAAWTGDRTQASCAKGYVKDL